MPKYPIVKMHWKDITGGQEWSSKEEVLKWAKEEYDRTYYTIGYLIEKNEEYVVLASTWGETAGDENLNDYSMIMMSVISKIETLTTA